MISLQDYINEGSVINTCTYRIEGDKIYSDDSFTSTHYVFTISDEFPDGYIVWNISSGSLPKGYIPLARSTGKYTVDTKDLIAWHVSEDVWKKIMFRKHRGGDITNKNYKKLL